MREWENCFKQKGKSFWFQQGYQRSSLIDIKVDTDKKRRLTNGFAAVCVLRQDGREIIK